MAAINSLMGMEEMKCIAGDVDFSSLGVDGCHGRDPSVGEVELGHSVAEMKRNAALVRGSRSTRSHIIPGPRRG